MMTEIPSFIDKRFLLATDEDEDKRISLHDAVKELVNPAITLHISSAGTIPYGVGYEIIRQFSREEPQFRIVTLGATSLVQLMCESDLVESLVVSYAGDIYPRPNVSAAFQRAFKKGLKIENWSLVSLISRLVAGAMGLEFLPTKSIAASSMEIENRDSFKSIDDPFGTERKVGLVKSIRPDLSIAHAWCADRSGNAIIVPPLGDGNFAFYASTGGVLLSAEKIVSTEYIRQHAWMTKVPSHLVKAVVELPFGAHPAAYLGPNGEGYSEDLQFILDLRETGKNDELLKKWIDEWVLSVNHDKYLEKLGTERLMSLVGLRNPESWRTEINNKLKTIPFDKPCNSIERMVINGSHEVVDSVIKSDYKVILADKGFQILQHGWQYTI